MQVNVNILSVTYAVFRVMKSTAVRCVYILNVIRSWKRLVHVKIEGTYSLVA